MFRNTKEEQPGADVVANWDHCKRRPKGMCEHHAGQVFSCDESYLDRVVLVVMEETLGWWNALD